MSTPIDLSFLDQVRVVSTMDLLVLDIKRHTDNNREKFKFVDDLLYFEVCFIFRKHPYASKFCKLIMIFQPLNILGSINRWNSFLEIFGGPKYRKQSQNLCYLITLAPSRSRDVKTDDLQ
jgi:hypothetical protein